MMKDHPMIEKLERDGTLGDWFPCWGCGEPATINNFCDDCHKDYLKKEFSVGLGRDFAENHEHDFYIEFMHETTAGESVSLTKVCKDHFNTLDVKDQHTQLKEFCFGEFYEKYREWRKEI